MFTEVKVEAYIGVALAPLAILPKAQRKGVGTALMDKAHSIAKENFMVLFLKEDVLEIKGTVVYVKEIFEG